MIKAIMSIIKREIRLNLGNGGGALLPSAFFAGAILILPFALGPDSELLRKIGPGYLWLALCLACLVSLERFYQSDLEDGSMDSLIIGPIPLSIIMLAKTFGQYLAIIIPLIMAMPIASLMINIEIQYVLPLCIQLIIGALLMFLLGGIGSALGAGIKRGGLLVALLALPLYTPIIIFGSGAAAQIIAGNGIFSQGFLFICAMTLFALILSPLAIAASMRLHAD